MAEPNEVKVVQAKKAHPEDTAGDITNLDTVYSKGAAGDITNLDTVYPKGAVGNLSEVSPGELLDFAKRILLFLFILVVFVFGVSYTFARLSPVDSPVIKVVDTILDITKTAVPSIVTLVLGFYFGKKI